MPIQVNNGVSCSIGHNIACDIPLPLSIARSATELAQKDPTTVSYS